MTDYFRSIKENTPLQSHLSFPTDPTHTALLLQRVESTLARMMGD